MHELILLPGIYNTAHTNIFTHRKNTVNPKDFLSNKQGSITKKKLLYLYEFEFVLPVLRTKLKLLNLGTEKGLLSCHF